MEEIQILPGKHDCGREFDMRITPAENDDKNPVAWIVYGFCKKCNIVMISGLFLQQQEPQQGRDFIIEYEQTSGKGSLWRDKE